MCVPGAIEAAVGLTGAVVSGINNARTESKNLKYKTQIAINNAKTASAEAQRQQQLGIEEARKEKIEGLRQASAQAARSAANGFDMTSATSELNYQDTINAADTDAQSTRNQYDLRADSYFDQAKDYLGQINSYKDDYKSNMRTNAINSLQNIGSVASSWYKNYSGKMKNPASKGQDDK